MGYTFVKFTYEELFHEKKSSFFFMFSLFVTLFCFVLFLGLQVDECILIMIRVLLYRYFLELDCCLYSFLDCFTYCLPFSSMEVIQSTVQCFFSSFIIRAFVVWRLLLFLFGIPIFVFTVLLVIRLEWLPSLNLWVVFIPLWFMDCKLYSIKE